jgi:Fe-S-cluster containining protein
VEWLAEYNDGTGVCVYLRGNKCSIYARRPVCCNAEAMFDLLFRNNMSEQEYIAQNLEICRMLNEAAQNEANCERIRRLLTAETARIPVREENENWGQSRL